MHLTRKLGGKKQDLKGIMSVIALPSGRITPLPLIRFISFCLFFCFFGCCCSMLHLVSLLPLPLSRRFFLLLLQNLFVRIFLFFVEFNNLSVFVLYFLLCKIDVSVFTFGMLFVCLHCLNLKKAPFRCQEQSEVYPFYFSWICVRCSDVRNANIFYRQHTIATFIIFQFSKMRSKKLSINTRHSGILLVFASWVS